MESTWKRKCLTSKNVQNYPRNYPPHHPVLYVWETLHSGEPPSWCLTCRFATSSCPESVPPLPQGVPCTPPTRPHTWAPAPVPPTPALLPGQAVALFHSPRPAGTLPSTTSPARMWQDPCDPPHLCAPSMSCDLLFSRQKVRTPGMSSSPCCTR